MRDDNVFKAASGFGGGIGGMADTCGALLGASMMLSLKYGRGREEIENSIKGIRSGIPVKKLFKWFEKEFGSVKCREIRTTFGNGVYYDMSVPRQRELAEEAGILKKCAGLTARTAASAAEILWEAVEEKGEDRKLATPTGHLG